MNLISFSFVVFVVFFSHFSQACPLGEKETHLTLQRVMLNFGKFVSPADAVSFKSRTEKEPISDSEIQAAVEKLGKAISCAEAVIQSPQADLLPNPAFFIKDEAAKKEYVDDFVFFMTDFKDGLVEYKEALNQVLAQKPESRDFSKVQEATQEMNQKVNRAHSKLFR